MFKDIGTAFVVKDASGCCPKRMSTSGHKQTFSKVGVMSALDLKANIS